ncbi:MAG: outer membrane protein transport protein [Polyangiaceae bacterium]|jgi:long-chain fatty acid transport protein|nr:outer membrane protein transport protein [Polyangiaceae bacterium]
MVRPRSLLAVLLCVLAALTSAREARAQALTAPMVGTSLSGPVTVDPAAGHWNPALLASLERPALLASGGLVLGDVRFTRERRAIYQREESFVFKEPLSPSQVDPGKGGKAAESRATPLAPSGSLFGALPLGKGLVAGLGVYAPYAALLSFEPGGAQRWALESATIAALYVTPSLGYRASEALSVGVGASYVLGVAELSKIQDFASLNDVGTALGRPPINQSNDFGASAPPSVRELAVMARPIQLKRALAHGFTFNAGVALRPAKGLLVGLSYLHSVAMDFNGRFALDMNNDFFTRDLASQGLAYKPRVEGDATLSFTLPRTVLLGVRHEVSPRVAVGLTGTYAWWSQVDAFRVVVRSPDLAQPRLGLPDTSSITLPRRWNNTIGVDAFGQLQATGALRLWLLGGYRSAASPDATIDAASPDGDRILAALGGSFALSERLSLLGDFKMQTILPRTVVGSELDLGNGEYRLSLFALMGHLLYQL